MRRHLEPHRRYLDRGRRIGKRHSAAVARKAELRRTMLAVHIAHLAQVGREAAREDHELGRTFRFKPQAGTYLAFRTAARAMAVEAETHREILIRHGLAASVLEEFVQRLDQFDAAVALGHTGRAGHMGATLELNAVAAAIVRVVRVMDGRNRQRFQDDQQLLGAWVAGSTVLGVPARGGGVAPVPPGEVVPGGTVSPAGDVRPAARRFRLGSVRSAHGGRRAVQLAIAAEHSGAQHTQVRYAV